MTVPSRPCAFVWLKLHRACSTLHSFAESIKEKTAKEASSDIPASRDSWELYGNAYAARMTGNRCWFQCRMPLFRSQLAGKLILARG